MFVLLLFVLTAGAGWYTSRSEFCRSCHIMEPYYRSWQESTHRDVPCIKCHFPPGFAEKVRGKMLGLVQLAKYVTRSEGPRPAAEIPDASCLRSGCHETRLLAGKVDFHGVPFDHTPHLEKVRRGKKLRCTSCHGQIVQGSHMSVTASTCFLCHFKGEAFNEGLGACTRCHQIPESEFDLGGGTKYNHDLAYTRGVDCANCHGDLIRGKGEVPSERCGVCHNREDDLKRIGDHVFIHQEHVTEHKVDCLDCHLEIQHSLDPEKLVHAASNCQSCHPDHHREQVDMLEGRGAKCVPAQVGGMPVVRVECRSCHRVKEVSATGTVLWKASVEMCTACHDVSDPERLESYSDALKALLPKIEAGILQARDALGSADLGEERSAAVAKQLDNLQHDLNFLRAANGVHNIHYARTLTRDLVDSLASLCRELKIPEPEITLPEAVDGFK
jgi:predicted CXXCH cytochrome family protein